MNNAVDLVRASRGPVLLIILGGLMALARFQNVSFTKTWPILLIALGVLKLAERLVLRPSDPPVAG